jgi:excisionase family DNA binding protein
MPDPVTDDLIITPPDGEDLELLRALAEVFDTTEKVFVRGDDGDAVALPESARDGLKRLISYLAADMAVTMKPYDEILTTREAAELLGMSRPYLVHLLETEAIGIPFEKVGPGAGGHRRISLRDVLAYRQTRDAENDTRIERSLEDLASEAEQTSAEASMPLIARARRAAH